MPKYLIAAATVLLIALVWFGYQFYSRDDLSQRLTNLPTISPSQTSSPSGQVDSPAVSVVATGLEVPWALAFLPDGGILVTEREGRVRLVSKEGTLQADPVATIAVKQDGESGLHGIAVHPDYPKTPFIYLYYTYATASNNSLNEQVLSSRNKVSRFDFDGSKLTNEKVIVDKIPGAIFHDGGRIKFGPDEYLYITTGDALEPSLAQNKNSLAGKILRIKDEGNVEVYSYGHRNPQGIAWDGQGNLFETEHGQSATDEFNAIQQGANYGWPDITGDESAPGINSPILQSGVNNTWAPGGLAFNNGSFFFGGLRGQALYQVKFAGGPQLVTHFKNQFGRIREVVLGPDNMLYITTSNRDGRGTPTGEDDRIIRINPTKL